MIVKERICDTNNIVIVIFYSILKKYCNHIDIGNKKRSDYSTSENFSSSKGDLS